MPQGRTKALLTIRGRRKGCVWNSSHRIRQKSDLSIATAIIQRIVETGKNNGPGGRFSKVPKLYGPFAGVTIPFVTQERRAFNSSNFTVNFLFVTLKAC